MWVLEAEHDKKGYAGIHKDGSLGFEYVAPQARRQGVASRMQAFLDRLSSQVQHNQRKNF